MSKPLTTLEDTAFRTIVALMDESDGWLDLTRICSRAGRHLGDVRQAVARLVRYGLVHIEQTAADNERWVKFSVPGMAESTAAE